MDWLEPTDVPRLVYVPPGVCWYMGCPETELLDVFVHPLAPENSAEMCRFHGAIWTGELVDH